MELCFNEMTVMKNGTLPEDIALCAQAGFSAVELRKARSCAICAAAGRWRRCGRRWRSSTSARRV